VGGGLDEVTPGRQSLTLCRAHHWAFDAGLYALTSDYTVVVSPLVPRADSRKFELLSLDGRRRHIPRREVLAPHRAALEWHQDNVFKG
jgi:putative restriction endonuclease